MALKGKPIAIGTSDTTIYTCPSTIEASVHGLVFANNTGSAVTITLKIYIQSLGTTTTVATGISVGANTTYTWPKPINVNAGDYIQAAASTGSALVCFYSVYEGSAAAAAVGFTPRGAWGSGSTYAVNDVVSLNGSSYLAIQASTNQNPSTATAYWLVLAAKGDTGAAGSGSGDVSGPASSVDSEIALFDSTTGKLIKRASTTGILKGTSGVLSAASAGTDYVAPGTATTFTADQTFNSTRLKLAGSTSGSATLNAPAIAGTSTYTLPPDASTLGYRNIPQSGSDKTSSYSLATTDIGEFVGVGTSGSITIPNSTFAAGDIVSIFNNTSGNITITCSITTAYIAGTNTDKDTMTLATRGVATILFISGTVCVVTGNVT
jgi:hypothetical protein